MLFACLKSHAKRRAALGIFGDPDNASGNRALVRITRGKKRGMGPTIAHGNPKALGVANNDIGTHLTRRLDQGQREEICRHNGQGPLFMCCADDTAEVVQVAGRGGVLKQDAETLTTAQFLFRIANQNFESHKPCSSLDDGAGLWMHPVINKEHV